MSSHSPQRPRKPQAHPISQGPMHNLQARENSRSPSIRDRPRALKTQSMPLVPSVVQMYATNNAVQQSAQQQNLSSTNAGARRSPQLGVQVQRLLPTPPNPPSAREASPDRRPSPQLSLPQQQSNTQYPRPINRGPPPPFLAKYHNSDSWQMTDELMAEIERADQQQSQAHGQPSHVYHQSYQRPDAESPPKETLERVRATERTSPKDVDVGQRRQREQQPLRESPKNRDRQPTSPGFSQAQGANSPESRISPSYPTTNHGESYGQFTPRESPPVLRRTALPPNPETRSMPPNQTPPQLMNARSPDRSLPVQEEPEDELAVNSKGTPREAETWNGAGENHIEQRAQASPTPSSDLHPEGNVSRYDSSNVHGGRDSRAGHRREHVDDEDSNEAQHRSSQDEEDGFTPRSPTAGLPEDPRDRSYAQANGRGTIRARGRNGPTDQMNMRGIDSSVFEQATSQPLPPDPRISNPRPQNLEHKQSMQKLNQHFEQANHRQLHDPRLHPYYASSIHPDDLQSFLDDPAGAYMHPYPSPRPDAPIPPTPHSQTAASSPSPLISGMYDRSKDHHPPFSPVAPVGSPYPFPYSHVRRNPAFNARQQVSSNYDPNHPSVIQEQYRKQWQIFAQNNQGHISDSTFSPSTTPFQAGYNPWAYLHTNRTLGGRLHDLMSLQSSPSHEPVALPVPPTVGIKKKDRLKTLRAQAAVRKPPPRVDSTQPRETSPEPSSSSGEETAGEEQLTVPEEEPPWSNGAPTVAAEDDSADWVDEDEEGDEDDLLELEYHPSYVNNAEKRRRRWEVGWDSLVQAFQALDRQTDATMVLLAAPSHTAKFHAITSRSVRRLPPGSSSSPMNGMRSGFKKLAAQRRASRSQKSSLYDILRPLSATTDGSQMSSEAREGDLRRALETALGSLGALGGIYEQREARWIEEMRRISEDRERVELLLRQVLGDGTPIAPFRGP